MIQRRRGRVLRFDGDIPLRFGAVALAVASYFYLNQIEPLSKPLRLDTWIDRKIPFLPAFVVPYITFHPLTALYVPSLLLALDDTKRSFKVNTTALVLSQMLMNLAYVLFPAGGARFQLDMRALTERKDLWTDLLRRLVYGNDKPLNAFPSNHVTWSCISMISLVKRLQEGKGKISGPQKVLITVLLIWLAAVAISTVFVKQHFLMDVYAGIILAYATYALSEDITAPSRARLRRF